jgi:hypothetical protein
MVEAGGPEQTIRPWVNKTLHATKKAGQQNTLGQIFIRHEGGRHMNGQELSQAVKKLGTVEAKPPDPA